MVHVYGSELLSQIPVVADLPYHFPRSRPIMFKTAIIAIAMILSVPHFTCARPSYHVPKPPPKIPACKYPYLHSSSSGSELLEAGMGDAVDALKLRSDFIQVLRSRRSEEVLLSVEPASPVTDPLYQGGLASREAMESCPKENITNFEDVLQEENLYLITEAAEQGRLPVLILSMKESKQRTRPAIVFLHSSYRTKEWVRPLLEAYASRGYIAVAIDSRYHGERARNTTTYIDALVSSWKNGDTMPFIYDTVWDLIKLADYLTQREDIDSSRIGITGESLGGMHAWFAGAIDTRYAVVVPIIGVQGFRWALDNDKWQGRVDSIKPVFEEARIDLGKSTIDREVVEKKGCEGEEDPKLYRIPVFLSGFHGGVSARKSHELAYHLMLFVVQTVWDRIAPGLDSQFDSPYTVPVIAPRPLLILNGAEDPRCPLDGLKLPVSRAMEAYKEADCPENFKLIAEPGIGHQMTALMVKEASDWFDKFLKRR